MKKWAGSVFDLVISEISYTELIDGAFKEKIKRVKDKLNNYSRAKVTKRVLNGAGFLGNIYKTYDKTYKDVGLADKIIAATSFVYNLPLVTSNVKDFPHPFFKTIVSKNIIYKKRNKDHIISADILKPDMQVLNYWYSKTK